MKLSWNNHSIIKKKKKYIQAKGVGIVRLSLSYESIDKSSVFDLQHCIYNF